MNVVFADSFYFFALLNPKDRDHKRAVEFSQNFEGRLVTTEWVLLELADGLAKTRQRTRYGTVRQKLAENNNCRVVAFDNLLHQDATDLYLARPDKTWSLTDCVSFVIMSNQSIREALTGDHHFQQAGFVALFGGD